MTNREVAKNWGEGLKGESNTMRTDGYDLYSYDLKIGYSIDSDKRVILYLSQYNNFISQTTSKHVGLAQKYCHITELPAGA